LKSYTTVRNAKEKSAFCPTELRRVRRNCNSSARGCQLDHVWCHVFARAQWQKRWDRRFVKGNFARAASVHLVRTPFQQCTTPSNLPFPPGKSGLCSVRRHTDGPLALRVILRPRTGTVVYL